MSNKLYVLMEVGFEYNDEIYFTSEGTGNHPEKIFTSEENAEAACLSKNIEGFRNIIATGSLYDYCYNIKDIMLEEYAEELVEEPSEESGIFQILFGMSLENFINQYSDLNNSNAPKLIKEPSQEEWKKLLGLFQLRFYNVVEVEKGD